jgi:hypothetical protein
LAPAGVLEQIAVENTPLRTVQSTYEDLNTWDLRNRETAFAKDFMGQEMFVVDIAVRSKRLRGSVTVKGEEHQLNQTLIIIEDDIEKLQHRRQDP